MSGGVGIVFTDTETGGVNPATDALLTVAFVLWRDGEIVGSREWAVQVEDRIVHEQALKINKIDLMEHAVRARPRDEVGHEMLAWLDAVRPDTKYKLRMGGHNTAFDVGFIRELVHADDWRGLVRPSCVDTAGLLTFLRHAGVLPPGSDISLRNGLKAAGIEVDPKLVHTAMGDALNTAKLYGRLLEMVRGLS